jgi:hypothetical protein
VNSGNQTLHAASLFYRSIVEKLRETETGAWPVSFVGYKKIAYRAKKEGGEACTAYDFSEGNCSA